MAGNLYALDENDVRFLRELAVEVKRLGGIPRLRQLLTTTSPREWSLARVTASTAGSTLDARGNPVNNTYSLQPVTKETAGYSTTATSLWTAIAGVPVITGAFHLAEDGNTGTGVQMNGVDFDGDLFDGSALELIPVPVNRLVLYSFFQVGTARECWFFTLGDNAVDGACEA